ncbi:hypothetical protein GGI07_005587 [Coemansia sp. Benny D115]|nr:hypothetical protein GGI07_005587 [Coemansia sp. Benny D115]
MFSSKSIAVLSTRVPKGILRATAKTRGEAKRAKAEARGVPSHTTSDPRYEAIKQILYQDEPRQLGNLSEADIERHECILRAMSIDKMEKSQQRRMERENKFAAMENAYEALRLADERLYLAACKREGTVVFPRQMRVPTETPGIKIWDYME